MTKFFVGEEAHWVFNFSMNLKEMIETRNTSIPKLAKKIGISPSKLRSYARAMSKPSDEHIRAIADALECNPSELTDKEYDTGFGTGEEY